MYRIYALILCLCLVGCTQKKDIEVSTQKENFSYEEVSENFSKLQCGDIINIENIINKLHLLTLPPIIFQILRFLVGGNIHLSI